MEAMEDLLAITVALIPKLLVSARSNPNDAIGDAPGVAVIKPFGRSDGEEKVTPILSPVRSFGGRVKGMDATRVNERHAEIACTGSKDGGLECGMRCAVPVQTTSI